MHAITHMSRLTAPLSSYNSVLFDDYTYVAVPSLTRAVCIWKVYVPGSALTRLHSAALIFSDCWCRNRIVELGSFVKWLREVDSAGRRRKGKLRSQGI